MTMKFQNNLEYDLETINPVKYTEAVAALEAIKTHAEGVKSRLAELNEELEKAETVTEHIAEDAESLEDITTMVSAKEEGRTPADIREEIKLTEDFLMNNSIPLFEAAATAIRAVYFESIEIFEPYKEYVSEKTWSASYDIVKKLNRLNQALSNRYGQLITGCGFYTRPSDKTAPNGKSVPSLVIGYIRLAQPTSGELAEFNHLLFQ